MGAAVLAGVGAGLVPDITAGANQMVRVSQVLEPDPERHQLYTNLYHVYERLYLDLCEAFRQLDAIARESGERAKIV
jgi:xylulokinase